MHAAPAAPSGLRPWWETRWFVVAMILVSAIPLLYPSNPPLVDLFGHMGRYRVELDLATSPWLKDYYEFHWAAIGNLGVDILAGACSGCCAFRVKRSASCLRPASAA